MAAYTPNLFILAALISLTMPLVATSRPLHDPIFETNRDLASRLNLDEESSNCWDSMFQLQACTGEVVMFFLNGETYLGHGCCEAIRIIQHECWPAMLCSLGFTTEETDILKGYCDEAGQTQSPPSLLPPPPPPSVDEPTKTVVP